MLGDGVPIDRHSEESKKRGALNPLCRYVGRVPPRWMRGLSYFIGMAFLCSSSLLAGSARAQRRASVLLRDGPEPRTGICSGHYPPVAPDSGSVRNTLGHLRWFLDVLHSSADRQSPSSRWNAFLSRWTLEQAPSTEFAPTWFSLGPSNISGRMLDIAFDPSNSQTIYAGSAGGGLWKTTDAGVTWRPIGDNLPTLAVGAIAVIPGNPGVIIAGTGEPTTNYDAIYGVGILRSTDGGESWRRTNVVTNPDSAHGGYHAIEMNSRTGVIMAAGHEGLLRSVDAGATWLPVEPRGNWTDVKWRPGSSDTAYAAKEYGGLFMSTDGGITFTHLAGGLPSDSSVGGLAKLAISPSNPDYVYAGLSSAAGFTLLGIYRSTDGGATWSLRSANPDLYQSQGYYNNTIIVDPRNPDRVFVGGFLLYVSNDGGITWTDQWDFSQGSYPHVDHHGIAFGPGDNGHLWVATDGGIYELSTADTWIDRNQGLVTAQFYSVCQSSATKSLAYGGAQDNGMLRYVGNPSWLFGPGGDGGVCNCDQRDAKHVYGEWESGAHFVSKDGFETWALINDGLFGDARFIAPVDLDPSDSERLFTATNAGIFRTLDGGNAWQKVGDGNDVVSLSISPANPRWVWALERSSGIVRRSNDGGDTWVTSQVQPFAGIGGTKVLADPSDSSGAFCAFLSHPLRPPVLLRTTDGGLTWNDVSGNLIGQSVNTITIDPIRPNDWYAGTAVGVWFSQDRGDTWIPFGNGLPYAQVLDLGVQVASRKLRAATHGRGLWEVTLPGAVATSGPAAAPLLLERTSSNPGGGMMGFRYAGISSLRVRLWVYDLAGRVVAHLADDPADGLVRVVTWDARGKAAGVYLAVLQSGSGDRVCKKVVLVR